MYPELEEIKKSFYLADILHKEAQFQCHSDNIFTYEVIVDNIMHEIDIIAEKSFFRNEKVTDLLDRPIFFLGYNVYIKGEGDNHDRISSQTFRIIDQEDYDESNT